MFKFSAWTDKKQPILSQNKENKKWTQTKSDLKESWERVTYSSERHGRLKKWRKKMGDNERKNNWRNEKIEQKNTGKGEPLERQVKDNEKIFRDHIIFVPRTW